MPFNGSGTFTIVNTFVPNTTILSAAVNQNFSDIATGLSDCLTRDGQAGMTAAFKAISGSVGAPGISFNSDATAGLYLSSTGIVGLVAKSLGLLVNSAIYQATSATVQAGGSGYAVGDTITETGGTAINQAVFTVATLTGSAVATVTVAYPGNYSVVPSNPVSQGSTSGIGTGCTLNITFAAQFASSIVTNEAGAVPWQRLGSSSFVSGLMAKANGLDFATAIGGSNIAAVVGNSFLTLPQGILSPSSSTTSPVPASDQTAVTRIYWTPYKGNICPIYNGVSFVNATSAQIFCDLTAGAQVVGGIYDLYKFLNAGTVTLGLSPSWSAGTSGSVTAGSCARGTSTGGTALTWINGIPTNAVAMTLNNGATTYSLSANQGTYLGSVYVDAVAGQYNCLRAAGQSRGWGLWNAWQQFPIVLQAASPTASWSNTPTTWRQSFAQAANFATAFCGLAEQEIDAQFTQYVTQAVNPGGNTTTANIGIGVNSTTSPSGMIGSATSISTLAGTALSGSTTIANILKASTVLAPSLGINAFNMIEQAPSGTTSNVFNGTGTNMLMTLRYLG